MRGNDKLAAVRRYTFMGHMAPGLGQLASHFRSWLKLADSTPVHRLGRSSEIV